MNETEFPTICAQVNSKIGARELMEFIGYEAGGLRRDGDVFLGFCPIHKDNVFRTLVLNPRNNTYQCRHLACPGNQAADFLDLVVRSRGRSLPEAVAELVAHFGPRFFSITEAQMSVVDDLVSQARSGRARGKSSSEWRISSSEFRVPKS